VAHNGYTFSGGLHDLDRDGDPDLYLVNDFGFTYTPNVFLRNRLVEEGAASFTDASAETWLGVAMLGMGMGLGDVDQDGLPDLLLAGWTELKLMVSDGAGAWVDEALVRGLSPAGEQHLAWGLELADLDNDGDLDAPVAYAYLGIESDIGLENPPLQPDALYVQGDGGVFEDRGAAWAFDDEAVTRGFALADLNRDGFLDAVKVALDQPATILLSRCDERAWLTVDLEQPAPNRRAVGAVVEVEAGGHTWTRWAHAGGTNLGSMGPLTLHFGLGALDEVERVAVTWPDGERTVFGAQETRQRLRIVRR